MNATPAGLVARSDWRELASRENDGLEVSLLWNEATGAVQVAVADFKRHEEFAFDIAGADALAAFNHPFAFAAGRDLRFGEVLRESTDLQLQS